MLSIIVGLLRFLPSGEVESGKNQTIRENQEILHPKVRENSKGLGKSGNKYLELLYADCTQQLKFFLARFARTLCVPPL